MGSVVDEKRRVTIPKHLAEELGLRKGSVVVFSKGKDDDNVLMVKKSRRKMDALEEVMSWDSKRTGKPKRVIEREVKEIWR